MTPTERLAAAGEALYGSRWQAPLAEDLGINRETIRRWLSGHTELPSDHGIFEDLKRVMDAKAAAIKTARKYL